MNEVRGLQHSHSRATDLSASEAGFAEDQKSLASINIIQVANSGNSPTNVSMAKKKLRSRFAFEGIQSVQARPPEI